MPLDPTLDELAGQQQSPLPPQMPWSQTPMGSPLTHLGQQAAQGAVGKVKSFNDMIGQMATGSPEEQGQASGQFIWDMLGTMPFGGIEKGALSGAELYANQFTNPWSSKELSILKKMYSSRDFDLDMLPGRSRASIFLKANELGLTKPKGKGPYVRQPGTPMIANDQQKAALIEKMVRDNFTNAEIAAKLGISDKTVRRYINENMAFRKKHAGQAPGMPTFNFLEGETPMGDPEYEKALEMFLRGPQSQMTNPSLEELFRSLT